MHGLLTKTVLVAAALAIGTATAHAGDTWPTPGMAYAMKGTVGGSGSTVGLAAVCATEGPHRVDATAFFAGFPRDRRPAQRAVRTAGGAG